MHFVHSCIKIIQTVQLTISCFQLNFSCKANRGVYWLRGWTPKSIAVTRGLSQWCESPHFPLFLILSGRRFASSPRRLEMRVTWYLWLFVGLLARQIRPRYWWVNRLLRITTPGPRVEPLIPQPGYPLPQKPLLQNPPPLTEKKSPALAAFSNSLNISWFIG